MKIQFKISGLRFFGVIICEMKGKSALIESSVDPEEWRQELQRVSSRLIGEICTVLSSTYFFSVNKVLILEGSFKSREMKTAGN